MDWDLKVWDLSELDPNMRASLAGRSESDCSVDLKLGGSSHFRSSPVSVPREENRVSMTAESPSSSSKRARAPSSGIQIASCLVEGCDSDLSGCREYHRRHKVCEVHSKTPIVIVNGQEQRFCQQCSRFHMLAEFDEGKRSCRKRLDGHNRRRRKPQSQTIHSGNLFSSYPGQSFTLYSEIFPAARPDSSCLRNGTSSSQFPGSYPRSSEEERRFPFASTRTLESSVCYPLTPTIAANSQGEMNERMFQGGLAQVLDSGLALSLLSSSSRSVGINFRNAATAGGVSQSQPTFSSFHEHCPPQYPYPQSSSQISSTGFSYSGLVDEQAGGLLLTEAVDPDLHC